MTAKFIGNIILLITAIVGVAAAKAQVADCSDAVSLSGAVVIVQAVSGDDTDNLQCAIDAAVAGKYTEVRLQPGDYEITALEFRKYTGIFGGAGFEDTFVTVQDGGMDCSSSTNNAVFKSVLGNTVFRWMTVDVGSPCSTSSTSSAVAVIGFYTDGTQCTKRVTFGQVDRARLRGLGAAGSDNVVGVVADTALECDPVTEQLAGVFTFNRSYFEDLDFGVLTSVAVAEQVDITYNEFSGVGLPVSIVNAKQTTTIQGNTFNFNDVPAYGSSGELGTTALFIASDGDARNGNSTVLLTNTFNNLGSNNAGIAVLTGQFAKSVTHSMVVIDNTFVGSADDQQGVGVASIDTSDGVFSANVFSGPGDARITISSGDSSVGFAGVEVSGWSIAGNSFESGATSDIVFSAGTSGNIVARDQGLPCVTDEGSNDVLESCASASVAARGVLSVGNNERYRSDSLHGLFASRAAALIADLAR